MGRVPRQSWENGGVENERGAVGYETDHVDSHGCAPATRCFSGKVVSKSALDKNTSEPNSQVKIIAVYCDAQQMTVTLNNSHLPKVP